ncbi:MAG: BrnT family toxin [Hormoscilla sp. GUM202]|nr:BrnT family toxin [Hormoscilla sp. GUM202]
MEFEWNQEKAQSNLSKHGVSFDEAKTVFDDPLYMDFYDPDHSYDEHRYIIIGESQQGRLLLVSYTERGNAIRLISARVVTRMEREIYEEGGNGNVR